MTKVKSLLMILITMIAILIIPNICNAANVEVERNIYSNNGSMQFIFSGLTLDKTHEYEFGLTRTVAEEVGTWHLITEYTESTAVVDVPTTTKDLRNIINAVDTGYVTIRDKTANLKILEPYSVDLKTPFLQLTNYTVIPNGKEFDGSEKNDIQIALRNADNSISILSI